MKSRWISSWTKSQTFRPVSTRPSAKKISSGPWPCDTGPTSKTTRSAPHQELADTRERANAQLLLKLVGVADDFTRAVNFLPEDAVDGSWYEGVQLVQRSLENMLQSEGVSRIEAAIGQPFDVSQHEAVFFEPTDEVNEGAVARVVRDGYRLHNRVLRAAQVSVAQAPEDKQA